MNPLLVINGVNAALALVEALLPTLQELKLAGQISAEQQQSVLDRYNSLKNRAEGQFSGPEWRIG